MDDVLGLHLLQTMDQIASPRRSVLARVDEAGRVMSLDTAGSDAEVVALVAAAEADSLVADAPFEVPNEDGRRDVETVLAWCDVPTFPVSAHRLARVFGGARGVALAPALTEAAGAVRETVPDQVLRQIIWEQTHPADAPPIDLAEYRAAWLGVRAPVYRAKGAGRARPEGTLVAWRLLSEVLDLGGWTPDAAPADDWAAIDDAARIDALCCAYAGVRWQGSEGHVAIGAMGLGRMVLPADANLRARVALTLDRMRAEHQIRI